MQFTSRAKLLAVLFTAFSFLVLFRLFSWQVLRADTLRSVGLSQQKSYLPITASRGSILASDGFPLASSSLGWLVWASLPDVKDPKTTAYKLAPLFAAEPGIDTDEVRDYTDIELESERKRLIKSEEERLYGLLTKEKVVWVPLKHKVDNETKVEIEKLSLSGIGFDIEERRSYPEGTMAAFVLGFVGKDAGGSDRGYFGLEGRYDVALSGRGGEKLFEKDALGNPILSGKRKSIAALNGVNLKTHIDRSIQFILDKHLSEGLQKYGASSGTIVVARPRDGAILGISVQPSYDPAQFSKFEEGDFINPAVSMTFEPGSIFKPLVMAAALDSGAFPLDEKCDQCSGPVRIGEYTVRTWDDKYYPDSTAAEIIKHSDNVGMVWVGGKTGAERLYDYLTAFGIGSSSGIDLQGEAAPKLAHWEKWGRIGLATTSFGQGVAATPIQMVRAIGAIANRGVLPTPQVVDKLSGDGWEEDVKTAVEKRVISEKTADQITGMMIDAVRAGEAKWAAPKNFTIAGKTGTAQIPVKGHYDTEKTIASFIGFAPACVPTSRRDFGEAQPACEPKFIMLVTLREPTSSPWAAETAAPLWFAIAKDLFLYLGVQPTSN